VGNPLSLASLKGDFMNLFSNYPDVVDVKLLQEMLGVGRNTAYELIASRRIKSIRIGAKIKIAKLSVIEFIEKEAA
jgi:excisionase family DNA binding protein